MSVHRAPPAFVAVCWIARTKQADRFCMQSICLLCIRFVAEAERCKCKSKARINVLVLTDLRASRSPLASVNHAMYSVHTGVKLEVRRESSPD